MIEEDFYATIKLKSGEEIFSKVAATEEDDKIFLIIDHPITISEYNVKNKTVGYKMEPWLKTTTDETFIINLNDVLTMSESSDIDMIMMYQSYIRQSNRNRNHESKITRKMGYISNVSDAKEILEKIYKGL